MQAPPVLPAPVAYPYPHTTLLLVLLLLIAAGTVFAILNPPFVPPHAQWKRTLQWTWIFSPALYLAAFAAALCLVEPVGKDAPSLPMLPALIFAVLSAAPPIFFFLEAQWLYGQTHGSDEDYKHSQELASRIWATLTLLLGFYWFHNLKG